MAIIFSDNFDGEIVGTTPPANWINESVDTCDVSNVQAHSGSNSMRLICIGAYKVCRHEEAAGFTSDSIVMWYYFTTVSSGIVYLMTNSATGNWNVLNNLAYIYFTYLGPIKYNDGALKDTGYVYTPGYHKIQIDHDFDSNTFDMWYDDVKIIAGGGFYRPGSSVKSIHCMASGNTFYVDDVQIGEATGWIGKVAGVTDPAKVMGIDVANIKSISGVE